MPEVLSFSSVDETHEAVAAYLFEGITAFFEYVPDVHIAMTSGPDAAQASLSLIKLLTQQAVTGVVHFWWLDEVFVAHDDAARRDRYIAELVENFRLGTFIECHRAPTPTSDSLTEAQAHWEQSLSGVDFSFAVIDALPDGQLLSPPGVERAIASSEAALHIVADAANIAIVATGTKQAGVIGTVISGNAAHALGQVAALEQTSIWLDDAAAGKRATEN